MQNEFVEFHDSTLAAIVREKTDVIIKLEPAYVHRSAGTPGIDPGTGWSVNVHLRFTAPKLASLEPVSSSDIATGQLRVGSKTFENGIPLPFESSESVELQLVLVSGLEVKVIGSGLTATRVGEYKLMEQFG